MIFIRPANGDSVTRPDGSSCAGWVYVGSANLSESAWSVSSLSILDKPADKENRGRIVHDRTRKEPKLNCRNWECGVVVPVVCEDESPSRTASSNRPEEEKDITEIFGTTVPVPMRVPAPPLGTGLKPWYGNW